MSGPVLNVQNSQDSQKSTEEHALEGPEREEDALTPWRPGVSLFLLNRNGGIAWYHRSHPDVKQRVKIENRVIGYAIERCFENTMSAYNQDELPWTKGESKTSGRVRQGGFESIGWVAWIH